MPECPPEGGEVTKNIQVGDSVYVRQRLVVTSLAGFPTEVLTAIDQSGRKYSVRVSDLISAPERRTSGTP
jgi:hypothetical protein